MAPSASRARQPVSRSAGRHWPLTRLLALTPDDPEALIDLARIAALEGREHEADTLVSRAVALTPDSILLDRALRAFALGDGADAAGPRELLGRAGVAPRTVLAVAVSRDDLAGTEYVARQLAGSIRSCEGRSLGHRMLAQAAVARGRPGEALGALREAESCGAAVSLELRVAYAVLPFLPVDTAEIIALREELDQDGGLESAVRSYARGTLALRIGNSLGSAQALDELGPGSAAYLPTPSVAYYAGSLAARLAHAEGRPRLALGRLERIRWAEGTATPPAEVADRYLRAELLEALGREEEALGWYASVAQRSSRELVFLAPAELRQAAIYDRRGDRAQAARHYLQFLAAWEDPEPALAPGVEWARTRLADLGNRGPDR